MELKLKTVNLLGRSFSFRTDLNDEEIEEVIRKVEEIHKTLSEKTGIVSTVEVAVMTSLLLSEELFKLKREKEEVETEVDNRIKNIIKLITEALKDIKGEDV
jgi:cell division protein ZapA (FtsZ GTPase activity inhibitor)